MYTLRVWRCGQQCLYNTTGVWGRCSISYCLYNGRLSWFKWVWTWWYSQCTTNLQGSDALGIFPYDHFMSAPWISESGKISNLRPFCSWEKILHWTSDNWGESFNMCNPSSTCCRFQFWAIIRCQRVNHSMKHYQYGLLEPKAHSCTLGDCTTRSFTPHLNPTLDFWRLETCCQVWQVSFPIALSVWMCMGMETTSWIQGPYVSAGDCSSWWRVCSGVGHV